MKCVENYQENRESLVDVFDLDCQLKFLVYTSERKRKHTEKAKEKTLHAEGDHTAELT